MLKALKNSVLSIVYPQECRVCGLAVENFTDGIACSDCWTSTRIFTGSEMLCSKCGAFLNESGLQIEVFCHKCDELSFDKARAVGVYEKALAAIALNLKREPLIPERLHSKIHTAVLRYNFSDSTLIVSVPLSKKRRLERGFNQAEVIAEIISKQSAIKIDRESLVRTQHTPIHRVAMDKKAREITVKNAFEVTRPKLMAGQNVLLVDDIFTSGATASACAKILKKNGAAVVNVLTLARAVMR